MKVLMRSAALSGALGLLLSCATAHAGTYDLTSVIIHTSTDDYNSEAIDDTGPCYSASTSGESVTTSAHDSITSTGPYATASTDIETADWSSIWKEWKWNSDGSDDYPDPIHSIITNNLSYTSTSSATGDSYAWVGTGDPESGYVETGNSSGSQDYTYGNDIWPEYRYFGYYGEFGDYFPDSQDGYYATVSHRSSTQSVVHISGNNGTAQASLDQSATWTVDLGIGHLNPDYEP